MTAFRRNHAVARAIPKKNALAQSGARSQQRERPALNGSTLIQNAKIFGRKMLQAVGGGAEIVYQNNGLHFEFAGQRFGINNPGKVGGVNTVVNDRAGNAKSRGTDFILGQKRGGLAGKFLDDQIKLRKTFTGKTLAKNHLQLAVFLRKERQIAFRTAHIARKNHRTSAKHDY